MDVPIKSVSEQRSKKHAGPCAAAAAAKQDHVDMHSKNYSSTRFLRRKIFTGTYEKVDRKSKENASAEGESSTHSFSGRVGDLKNPSSKKSDCDLPLMETAAIIADLEFLLSDEAGRSQKKRINEHLKAIVRSTLNGFCIRDLRGIVTIANYLVDYNSEQPGVLSALLGNASHVVWLTVRSDAQIYENNLIEYYNFLGYLLMRLEADDEFELAMVAACEQLQREAGPPRSSACPLRVRRAAAAGTTLITAAAKMLALANARRFPQYLRLALLLASGSADMCKEMVEENIVENLLYRFNPYFPEKDLPPYDINPQNPHDDNVKLGDSSINSSSVLSLLLILLHSMTQCLATDPDLKKQLKCPDSASLRSWTWAFRLECRALGRSHERRTMLAVVMSLLACYGDRLPTLADCLMPDLMSLAVLTEVPAHEGWLGGVHFNTLRGDVEFKKLLIYTSVLFLKNYPYNVYLVDTRHWMVGLMYLVDPCLYPLKYRWDEPLFAELRKAALMAMVAVLPLCPSHLAKECGLIRRILWYIEWYTVSPFEPGLLYWSMRLVRAAGGARGTAQRQAALMDLADSHALVVIIKLCYVLLEGRRAPVERVQAVMGQCLRVLASAAEQQRSVLCLVYPHVQWPVAVTDLAETMLDALLHAPNGNVIVTPRWTLSVLNFIWECIIWKETYRTRFISYNGIYKILDIISCSRSAAVQCMGLALVCEVARAGQAVAHLVSWRAPAAAGESAERRRGVTLVQLLAGIARDECRATGVRLHPETGVIQDEEYPLASAVERQVLEAAPCSDPTAASSQRALACHAAAGLAGSRLSKIYALLRMMSDDLAFKVSIADEAYNMFKNVSLSAEDEVMLVLCSHYQACKIGEVWGEVQALLAASHVELLEEYAKILDEFIQLYRGWAREIKYQQEKIYEIQRNNEAEEEASLHALLSRCRLTTALDALRELSGCARAADAAHRGDARLRDAMSAHRLRRAAAAATAGAGPVLGTYKPPIDIINVIGQNVKVQSIPEKPRVMTNNFDDNSCECGC